MKTDGLKLTVIGGGSSYTPELADGIIKNHAELPVHDIWLVDVKGGSQKQEIVAGLLRRMIQKADLEIRVHTTLDRRAGIEGADFIINQFRVGGLAARSLDERIPLKYGLIGQETTGAGGFAKALRTIPIAESIAADVRSLAPGAFVINFTNPSGMVTEAFSRSGLHRVIGLCNIPLSMQMTIAKGMGLSPNRIRLDMTGLNHLSWARRIWLDDRDVTREVLASEAVAALCFRNVPSGRSFLQALGMVPSPYLRYYYFPRLALAEQQAALASGRGTRADEVMAVERELFAAYGDPELAEKPPQLSKRGGAWYSEAAVSVMRDLHTHQPGVHVVNTLNLESVPDLLPEDVIETNCRIDGSGVRPVFQGGLPEEIRGLVQQVKNYERLTISAALSGDQGKALLALTAHPLIGDVGVIEPLWADILGANRAYLPQFGN